MENNTLPLLSFDSDVFVQKTVEFLRTLMEKMLQEKPNISLALSGGNSPLPIYKALLQYDLPWERIRFFMVDERCVASSDPQCNYGNIHNCFLNAIPSKSFPMVTEIGSYEEQAKAYAQLLRDELPMHNGIPQLDLVLLGMGLDGHTASLFPNTEALNNTKDLVVLNEVPQLETQRITMTYPLLQNANRLVLLAGGKEKKAVLDALDASRHPIAKLMPQIYKIIN